MRHAHIWLVLPLILLGGCASMYSRLHSEDEFDDYRQWKQVAQDQGNHTTRHPTVSGDGPVVRVAIHETGKPSTDRVFVMLHGVLSDHHTWRFVIGAFGTNHNLLVVDLPGCGDSDRPHPRVLGPNGYSPDALAERVLQALGQHLASREPRPRITLVGHSLGGTIAIRMMASPVLRARHDRVLRQVDRMVLLSPADAAIVNPPAVFKEIAEATAPVMAIADLLGILREGVSEAIRDAVNDPERALREEADRMYTMLARPETLLAMQAMLVQAAPMRGDGRPDWPAVERLVADYANVDVPCLILWGARDETLPVSMGYKLASQIPSAELHVVPNCKHSVHLEDPALCANMIKGFTAAGSVAFLATPE